MTKLHATALLVLILLQSSTPARADTVYFDFNQLQSLPKGSSAPLIEAYMERLYGSDIAVSTNTAIVNAGDGYLTPGKGKAPAIITIDFGNKPINSFSVDFELFKKTKNFTILADGVAVEEYALSRAQAKAGLVGHASLDFDTSVHTLQFVGSKKRGSGMDNLKVESLSNEFPTESPVAPVPEPPPLWLLAFGLMMLFSGNPELCKAFTGVFKRDGKIWIL
jgi:hypothetical protein